MYNNSKIDFWIHHIEKCGKSDLSQAEYCMAHEIALSTFCYWKRKLKQDEIVKPVFYPLEISSVQASNGDKNDSGIAIHLKGGRYTIGIEKGFSSSVLSQVVSALEKL